MPFCVACKLDKPLEDFHKNKNNVNGHCGSCKACAIGRTKDWYKRAKEANPEKYKLRWRKASLAKYSLTLEEYNDLLSSQEGKCKICKCEPKDMSLGIDHDHRCCPAGKSCGKCVRGLLCSRCNLVIGLLYEDSNLLNQITAYLLDSSNGKTPGLHPENKGSIPLLSTKNQK